LPTYHVLAAYRFQLNRTNNSTPGAGNFMISLEFPGENWGIHGALNPEGVYVAKL